MNPTSLLSLVVPPNLDRFVTVDGLGLPVLEDASMLPFMSLVSTIQE